LFAIVNGEVNIHPEGLPSVDLRFGHSCLTILVQIKICIANQP